VGGGALVKHALAEPLDASLVKVEKEEKKEENDGRAKARRQ
jgi:hypothetical protein